MHISHYKNEVVTAKLVPDLHYSIKTNRLGKHKFKLKGKFKKFLKKQQISYYFLWGNDFPTEILLRDVTEESEFLLKLSW